MDERSIYVAQLHKDVDDDLLLELFTQAGPVKNVAIRDVRDSDARFAIIEFEHDESVLFAIEIMNGVPLFGVSLSVKPRNNSKQESLYREKRAEIEKRNHPQSLMSSGNRSQGHSGRDRGSDSRDRQRTRDWEPERNRRGSNGGSSFRERDIQRDTWRNGLQNEDRGGQWSRGNNAPQYSTPQASHLLPHQHFVNHVLQQQAQYSAPAAYHGWQHQLPPPPPPPQRNNHQTPHRRPDRHGFDRGNRDGGWKNNGRY